MVQVNGQMYLWNLRKVPKGQELNLHSYLWVEADEHSAREWFQTHCMNPTQSYGRNPEAFLKDYKRYLGEKATETFWEISLRKVGENEFGTEIP